MIASLEVFGGCVVDMVLATLVDPNPTAAPGPSQVSTSTGGRAGVDPQESRLSGYDDRPSSVAALRPVRVVPPVLTDCWCPGEGPTLPSHSVSLCSSPRRLLDLILSRGRS